jgi:hypothetical protein
MAGGAARLGVPETADPTAAASSRRTARPTGAVSMEQRPPATETTPIANPAARGARIAAGPVARANALIAVATLARATTLIAARAMAARAAAVQQAGQVAEATVHHPDRLEDRSHQILRIAAVRDRRREVRASRVNVDRRDLAGNRVASNPGPYRGRGDPSDRNRGGQR